MSHFGRSGPPDIRDTYSLLVLNITFRTTADDLYPLFDKYGKVVDVFIPRDRRTGDSRGFAFVRYKYQDEAQKAVEKLDGIEMITEIEIIERGAGVEVGVDLSMIDTVVGIEIVIGTEAAVEALITIKVVVEVDMMMRGVAEVVPMEVPLLLGVAQVQGGVHLLGESLNLGMVAQVQGGVHLLAEPLNLGMVAQMDAMRKNALQLQEVCHPVAGGLSLEAHLHVLMLMNDSEEALMNFSRLFLF
nr:serine/arginine-rich splicing factor SC35-like isoform X1 [Ipomoea batatas]